MVVYLVCDSSSGTGTQWLMLAALTAFRTNAVMPIACLAIMEDLKG